MKNILIKQIFIALLGLVFMASCEYEIIVPEEITLDPNDTISFANEILPIFSEGGCNVSNCHGGSWDPNLSGSADVVYTNIINGGYVVDNNPDASDIYLKPTSDPDHDDKYTAEQAAKVKQWIKQGALNN